MLHGHSPKDQATGMNEIKGSGLVATAVPNGKNNRFAEHGRVVRQCRARRATTGTRGRSDRREAARRSTRRVQAIRKRKLTTESNTQSPKPHSDVITYGDKGVACDCHCVVCGVEISASTSLPIGTPSQSPDAGALGSAKCGRTAGASATTEAHQGVALSAQGS